MIPAHSIESDQAPNPVCQTSVSPSCIASGALPGFADGWVMTSGCRYVSICCCFCADRRFPVRSARAYWLVPLLASRTGHCSWQQSKMSYFCVTSLISKWRLEAFMFRLVFRTASLMGEYRGIMTLCRVLPKGTMAKAVRG